MKEYGKIWMNGKFVPFKDAKVHVLTHALHYSTAVFEGIRCYDTPNGSMIFRLPEHVNRLFKSATMYSMKLPYSKKQILDAIILTVKKSTMKECYIRPIAYYGYNMLGLTPTANRIDVAIACLEFLQEYTMAGKIRGTRCMVSKWLRIDSKSQPMQAKAASNYANAALARVEALKAGFDEAIMLNYDHMVAEGSAENIFLVNDKKIVTPPLSAGILPGITRESVIEIARAEKLSVIQRNVSLKELLKADEVFMTGTASEIKPVTLINTKKIGDGLPGELTLMLHKIFMDTVSGSEKRFSKWLTPVR